MKQYIFLFLIILNGSYLSSQDIDVTQPLHIQELMPRQNLFVVLAVDPAIPKNFVALGYEGKIEYSNHWVYWGPKEVIEAYFKDPKSLSEPIIKVCITPNLIQNKYGSLDEESLRQQFSKLDPKISLHFGKWGIYPYCLVSGDLEDRKNDMAYVGLNEDNGTILLFNLVVPHKSNGRSEALKLWNKFFQETTQLPEPLFFKAHGQEMHAGFTIVDVVGRKIKVTAERRKSDHMTRFAVLPQDETVKFEFNKVSKQFMDAQWHFADPLLKIVGEYIVDDGWVHYFMTTSVLIKEVDQFTPISPSLKNVLVKEI